MVKQIATARTRAARKADAARKITANIRDAYTQEQGLEVFQGEATRASKPLIYKVRPTKSGNER